MTSRSRVATCAALVAVGLSVAACGSSGSSSSRDSATPAAGGSTSARGSGPVDVLYAGSLVDLMKTQVGPGLKKATGYTFKGYASGSTALATQIKGKVRKADVFISADPDVNKTLEGSSNGDWVSWYATYASSPLVLGYNPKSAFAKELKSTPWYNVIGKPGFRVGRTDPVTDPKGALTKQALEDQGTKTPALRNIADSTSGVYPEETLVGRMQSGQLDAGFFYKSEAIAAGIPTVPLTGQKLKAVYTITVLNRAPHPKAANAFVNYLLGPKGAAHLKRDGYTIVHPAEVTGHGVPSAVRDVIPAS